MKTEIPTKAKGVIASINDRIYLDTLATSSLTNDIEKLSNPKLSPGEFSNANGTVQKYNYVGTHPLMGKTIYLPQAEMNIASFDKVRQNYKPIYNDEKNEFLLKNRRTSKIEYSAQAKNGIFELSPVQELIFGAIQNDFRDELFLLHSRLLHTSKENMLKSISMGHYKDVIKDYGQLNWSKVDNCPTCKMFKDGKLPKLIRGKLQDASAKHHNLEKDDPITNTKQEIKYNLKKRIDVRLHFDMFTSVETYFVLWSSNLTITLSENGYEIAVQLNCSKQLNIW